MLFQQKVKTVGTVSEFMNGGIDMDTNNKAIKEFNRKMEGSKGIKAVITTVAGMTFVKIVTTPVQAHASVVEGVVYDKVLNAFDPLVHLIQGVSYPIALVMLTGGGLMFMIGQRERGLSTIQNTAIGFILVQMMPLLMDLLAEIAKAV